MKKRVFFLPMVIQLAMTNSVMAISLGPYQSVTLIGRPLDMSVQATLDASEDPGSLCPEADVFYGDNQLSQSRVRVTAERVSPSSQGAVVRVRSSSVVNEPLVMIHLRVGCQQKTERRYVLLADMATEVAPDVSTVSRLVPPLQLSPPTVTLPPASLPAVNPAVTRRARTAENSTDSTTTTATAEASFADSLRAAGGTVQKRDRRAAAPGKTQPSLANRPRLKLDPLDLNLELDPQLKSSLELLSQPTSSPEERSAAAVLRRAISAQPLDLLRDAERLQSLENSVRSLQAESQKTQQSVNELGAKLKRSESERYANPLVYALSFFLLVALGGLAYLTRKQLFSGRFANRKTPWWRQGESQQSTRQSWPDSEDPGAFFDSNKTTVIKKANSEFSAKAELAETGRKLDSARTALSPQKKTSNSDFNPDLTLPLAAAYPKDFSQSISHESRTLKSEELLDVQQQADFFVSIDQYERAIEVLRDHISGNVETSALVYLDLFGIYHQLARRDEYAALSADFNSRFNTKIPAFEQYSDTGPGLEAYQSAMSRIEALWPSPKVLEVIEESVFRRPETSAEAFNVEAYRDLLMLYTVGKEIISSDSRADAKPNELNNPGKFELLEPNGSSRDTQRKTFVSTSIQPLSATIDQDNAAHTFDLAQPMLASTLPHPSTNVDIDLDFTELPNAQTNLDIDESGPNAFAELDKDFPAAFPALNHELQTEKKQKENPGNLIEFDL